MTAPAAPEQRSTPRPRTYWKGTIVYPGGLRSVECIVRNFNAEGAKLDCGAIIDIPDHFELTIPQKGETFQCHVCWRQPDSLGVRFQVAETEGDGIARKLKVLEDQNRKLMKRLSETNSD